jgi:subtilisin family serine protease
VTKEEVPIMSRLVSWFGIVAMVLATTGGAVAGGPPVAAGEDAGGDYIITLRDDVRNPAAVAAEIARRQGLEVTNVFEAVLNGFAARVPAGRAAALRHDDRVVRIDRDLPTRISSTSSERAFVDDLPTGVDRVGGDVAGQGTPPTRAGSPVAVLDTGIAPHTELNVAGGYNCTSKNRKKWQDGHGHGTHVAGIVGARSNGSGVVGVAPGTPLYAVKVLGNNGGGKLSWAVCGLNWTVKRGIKIANMTLGATAPNESADDCRSSSFHQAICRAAAGVRVVVAAGNSGEDAGAKVPAKYSQVVTVSALADSDGCAGGLGAPTSHGDPDDSLATYSNFGAAVDVAAPGSNIRSTWLGGDYKSLSGTSMATPHVAAAYALGWEGAKELGPIPGDGDGHDEGILKLSENNTRCSSSPGPVATDAEGTRDGAAGRAGTKAGNRGSDSAGDRGRSRRHGR